MKYAAPVRRELGFRTIFNLIGPLSNPARVRRQLVGVYAREWVEPVARALQQLGCESAWVVHGGGMDELTVTDTSTVSILDDGHVFMEEVAPEDCGLQRSRLAAIRGGTAQENATALTHLFDGETGAYRDMVLLNAAAALVIAEKAENLPQGVALAAEAIDKGLAKMALAKLVECSNA
jgi:anthranilate phosphoribosyltransferase